MPTPSKPHARSITPADKAAAARLNAIWKAHKAANGGKPTQDELADAYGDGANQSLMSQYLNGHIALNARAVRFFARYFGVPTSAIRDDLEELRVGADEARLLDLERQVQALNMALGAMSAVMVQHRPAEAAALAGFLQQLPTPYRDVALAKALSEELELAGSKRASAR